MESDATSAVKMEVALVKIVTKLKNDISEKSNFA
jgi:hypothetical protein